MVSARAAIDRSALECRLELLRLAVAGALVIVAVPAIMACTGERVRTLPADRSAPVLYVALGDSTVEGVAATSAARNYVSRLYERLHAAYPAARMVNLGEAGAISSDVVSAQLPRAVTLRPDLVTLSVGPNDITGGISADEYAKNLDRVLRTLGRETHALVVVNLLPDLAVTPRFSHSRERERVARLTVQFNEALSREAVKHGGAVVDLYRPSREEVPRHPELVAADGYHPSDLGYERWAELMWAAVQPRIARP